MADEKPNAPKIRAGDSDMERARAWWHDYGRAIVAGTVIGLASVVGFNYWQHREQTRAEAASDLFETMHELIATHATEVAAAEAEAEAKAAEEAAAETADDGESDAADDGESDSADDGESDSADDGDADDTVDAESDDTAETVETEIEPAESETAIAIRAAADELMADYASTPYAVHAAFALAKLAVDDGDLAPAAQALQWILDNADDDDPVLRHIARLRLASVLLADGEAARVIELLRRPAGDDGDGGDGDGGGFAARYDELSGDAHLQNGDVDAARESYQNGLDQLQAGSVGHVLLKLKLDNLGG